MDRLRGVSPMLDAASHFATSNTAMGQLDALRDLAQNKTLQQASRTELFATGLRRLAAAIIAPDPEQRLCALSALGRIWSSLRLQRPAVEATLSSSVIGEPAALANLTDPDDRAYAAQACRHVSAPWVREYLALAVAGDTAENVRTDCLDSLLTNTSDLRDTLAFVRSRVSHNVLHRLQERIKELTALHQTARILQAADGSPREALEQIVRLLPAAWQYPSVAEARIQFRELAVATSRFTPTPWMQVAVIAARGQQGLIEVAYTEERPASDEGPFLREERDLIDSLAEMLRSYFQHLIADEGLQEAQRSLERQVRERTEELARANEQLSRRIQESSEAQSRIKRSQAQLRQLASQLAVVEARERRAIAIDLHDHIGQALAFIRMHVAQLQGNATFCGFEEQIADTLVLLDQTIRYTRDLTCQISPPVLYELGLAAALRWLGESCQAKHKLLVNVDAPTSHRRLADEISATVFKAVQELVTNVVKHAGARSILIRLQMSGTGLRVEVSDDGSGFDAEALPTAESLGEHFGLFNIREQIRHLGGETAVVSSPGSGTRVSLELPCGERW